MKPKVKDLEETGIPVRFGLKSDPEKFQIDLLREGRRRLTLKSIDNFDELTVEIGERLEESTHYYGGTRARREYPPYGSVWVNFYSSDGKCANISLVPHLDKTGHIPRIPIHYNPSLHGTDFDGSVLQCDKRIPGHIIPANEPLVVSITCFKESRKGMIDQQAP